jgi:hypothetical protein
LARNKTETTLKLKIPSHLTAEERKEVALRAIDFIVDRTQGGKNVHGKKWTGKAGRYTDAYAEVKGTGKSPVDLTDTTKMLDSIKFFKSKSKSDELVVGYRKGTKQERKAEGNIQGTYGQPRPIPGKARPFLDILTKDLTPIIKEVISEREPEEGADPSIETDDTGTSLFFRR